MKPSQAIPIIETAVRLRQPLLIVGEPGIGKTDIIKYAVLERLKQKLIISHPSISDPTDFKGLGFPNEDRTYAKFLPFGDLAALINAKEPTVWFPDDMGQASTLVQAAMMQMFRERKIGDHSISPLVAMIGATNRTTDRAGVSGIIEPMKSRFLSIINLEVDHGDWCNWAIDNGLPPVLIAFMRWNPKMLLDFKPTKQMTNSPSPRSAEHVGTIIENFPESTWFELIEGAAGKGFAAEFIGYQKVWQRLPNVDALIANGGDGWEVPKDPALLYALSGAVSAKANKKNIGGIVKISHKLPGEFAILMIDDVVHYDPTVTQTREYVEWAIKFSKKL